MKRWNKLCWVWWIILKGGLEEQVEESLGLSNTSRLRIEPNEKQFAYMKPIQI